MNSTAEQWCLAELAFDLGPEDLAAEGVEVFAEFRCGDDRIRVRGFADGPGRYCVRFMPPGPGTWTWLTASNLPALDGRTGTIAVAATGRAGPVRAGATGFHHPGGRRFWPFGTTVYALSHQPDAEVEETMQTLAAAPFNKVRMCVFPKHFKYNANEPPRYPFEVIAEGQPAGAVPEGADHGWRFDFSRPNPEYFRRLESHVARLAAMGIEAELILFHPYDRWGFARMAAEEDDGYLRYVVARFAGFANVWWSLANEFDLMPAKSAADWDRFLQIVAGEDPYGHPRSVHNCLRYFDHDHPRVTHVSNQREDPAHCAAWSARHGKPAIDDECGYEGDLADGWGNLSGPEMLRRVWDGVMAGGGATHGETFRRADERVFWARGGRLRGESVARIGFLRQILESLPAGLAPMPTIRRQALLAGGTENLSFADLHAAGTDPAAPEASRVVIGWFATLAVPGEAYLVYFGGQQPSELYLPVAHGGRYRVSLIDTWGMSITPLAAGAVRGQVIEIPPRPWQAVLLSREW